MRPCPEQFRHISIWGLEESPRPWFSESIFQDIEDGTETNWFDDMWERGSRSHYWENQAKTIDTGGAVHLSVAGFIHIEFQEIRKMHSFTTNDSTESTARLFPQGSEAALECLSFLGKAIRHVLSQNAVWIRDFLRKKRPIAHESRYDGSFYWLNEYWLIRTQLED
jgi:hypothetical protein